MTELANIEFLRPLAFVLAFLAVPVFAMLLREAKF